MVETMERLESTNVHVKISCGSQHLHETPPNTYMTYDERMDHTCIKEMWDCDVFVLRQAWTAMTRMRGCTQRGWVA